MTIALYHGSANKIDSFSSEKGGLYFTPDISIANSYLVSQADNATGLYGHIYTLNIDMADLIETEDIDQSEKVTGVLFCEIDGYYRIDDLDKYRPRELSEEEIHKLI